MKEFRQTTWEEAAAEWRELVRLAIEEDLGREGDLTSSALVAPSAAGSAAVVTRQAGVVAGLHAAQMAAAAIDPALHWTAAVDDGTSVAAGATLAQIAGPAASILAAERLLLNVLGRLSGIATATRRFVDAVAGTPARIYDTRKTTPGWRRLEKYAVRCGGGQNHRGGLYEAVLIKDNHLAFAASRSLGPAEAVTAARQSLHARLGGAADATIVEVEVDTLEQLDAVLAVRPDIVLLDNMDAARLAEAVRRRDAAAPGVQLEASGGIRLENVRAAALAGVDRISIGGITHSAVALDIGLDWR